jgi:hypothetical protein
VIAKTSLNKSAKQYLERRLRQGNVKKMINKGDAQKQQSVFEV